jgi:molecular chaperone HscB
MKKRSEWIKNMNYFELFDLPIAYTVDESKLTDIYLKKQAVAHPDSPMYNQSTPAESAMLNIAYKTLMDPLMRAEYFLVLHNIKMEDIDVKHAAEVFDIYETHAALKTTEEKELFQDNLSQRVSELEKSLYGIGNDISKFCEIFGLLRFINVFLEKVRVNAYNRD